jgi:hypothetical protein
MKWAALTKPITRAGLFMRESSNGAVFLLCKAGYMSYANLFSNALRRFVTTLRLNSM